MSIDSTRFSRLAFTLFSYPEYVWMTYQFFSASKVRCRLPNKNTPGPSHPTCDVLRYDSADGESKNQVEHDRQQGNDNDGQHHEAGVTHCLTRRGPHDPLELLRHFPRQLLSAGRLMGSRRLPFGSHLHPHQKLARFPGDEPASGVNAFRGEACAYGTTGSTSGAQGDSDRSSCSYWWCSSVAGTPCRRA